MKISSCITHPALFGQPLSKVMDFLIASGFDGIDIPTDAKTYPVSTIKPIIETYGKRLPVAEITACINPDRDLIHPEIKKRQIAIDYIKQCIDTANALGVKQTHMCFITSKDNLNNNSREKLEQIGVASIKDCAQYAREHSVRLLLEPLFKGDTSLVNRCDQAVSLFSKAVDMAPEEFIKGTSEFGLLLDLFHMHHEETDLVKAIQKYQSIAYHVHVADHPRTLDFTRADSNFVKQGLNQLSKQKYNGFVSFETFDGAVTQESFPKALQQLKKWVN